MSASAAESARGDLVRVQDELSKAQGKIEVSTRTRRPTLCSTSVFVLAGPNRRHTLCSTSVFALQNRDAELAKLRQELGAATDKELQLRDELR